MGYWLVHQFGAIMGWLPIILGYETIYIYSGIGMIVKCWTNVGTFSGSWWIFGSSFSGSFLNICGTKT